MFLILHFQCFIKLFITALKKRQTDNFILPSRIYYCMTLCNRCGNDFENYFNGVYWCVYCGKQFLIDENLLKQLEKSKKYTNQKEVKNA